MLYIGAILPLQTGKQLEGGNHRRLKDLYWGTSSDDVGQMELHRKNILGSFGLSTRYYLGRRKATKMGEGEPMDKDLGFVLPFKKIFYLLLG